MNADWPFELLTACRNTRAFNQYQDVHPELDRPDGAGVRCHNLRCFLSLFPSARPHAIGRVAQRALQAIGMQATYIRYPSHGGKRKFVAGAAALELTDDFGWPQHLPQAAGAGGVNH